MSTTETNDMVLRFINERMNETCKRLKDFDRCRMMHGEIMKKFGVRYANFFLRNIFVLAMAYPNCSEQELLVKFAESLPNPDAN